MKTLYSLILTAVAVATLAISGNVQAQTRHWVRGGSVEKADAASAKEVKAASAMPAFSSVSKPKPKTPPVKYPKYRLIDLGTLGGDNAFTILPAVTMNNRGEIIAQASNGSPDPFPPDDWLADGTIWHGILSNGNGIVRDLGGLAGNHSVPTEIAENGLIAGLGENGSLDDLAGFPQLRALLWDAGRVLHNLGTLGGNTSLANSLNNHGQVVGSAANAIAENPDVASYFNSFLPAAQQIRAFLWEDNAMRDLGTLGGNDSTATAISQNGNIVGFASTDTAVHDTTGLPTLHPFLWKNGRMTDLGSLGGTLASTGSFAFGPFGKTVNDQGQVIGTSMLSGDQTWHAFVWDKSRMLDLGTLGGDNSEAFFLSDNGQVLGRAEVSMTPYVRHAFIWENGRMTDLGAPAPCTRSSALSMNAANQIVGDLGACTADSNDPNYFSVFYQEKGRPPVDLHTLITPPSPIHLDDAGYINDKGEISAAGSFPDGRTRAVLLVPIP